MADWAETRAREWYRSIWPGAPKDAVDMDCPSLAALLREVAEVEGDEVSGIWSHRMSEARAEAREQVLAEVRRVVDEVGTTPRPIRSELWNLGRMSTCDEILSRIEKLGRTREGG